MRIHSNILTRQHIFDAAQIAQVQVEEFSVHGSRKRAQAFEVKLSGSSPYAAQSGAWKAATWDEWGIFLMHLLDLDCTAIAGPYNGRAEFLKQTREAVEHARQYEQIVGRKSARTRGMTGPWLRPLAGEAREDFEREVTTPRLDADTREALALAALSTPAREILAREPIPNDKALIVDDAIARSVRA